MEPSSTLAMSAGSSCLFCRIASGTLESAVVFEDEVSIAFLDDRPLFPGHCLLIPRRHHESLLDLPPALVAPLFANVQLLARAIKHGFGVEGVFIGINNQVSQSVPHLHIHVVPRRPKDGLRGFFWPRQRYSDREAMQVVREALKTAIAVLRAGTEE